MFLSLLLLSLPALPGCGGKSKSGAKKSEAITVIDKAFQPLRRDFEGEVGKVRLVAVVTPTCGECLMSVEAIHDQLMSRIPSDDFVVFVLWASIAAGDVTPRAERAAEQYADPRMLHYWDDSGRIARAFAAQMEMESGRSIYNVVFLYGKNDTWDPEAKMVDEPPDHNALLDGWMPAAPRYRMGDNSQVKLPSFNIDQLTNEIETLLAEKGPEPGRPGR